MERLEAIEQLIEAGRDEAPRILAERSREAVNAVEAGLVAALDSARERLRPEPKRPSAGRIVLIGLGTAIAVAVIGFVIAYAIQRLQRMREQRGGRFGAFVREAERASDALERDSLPDERDAATEPRVSIPISSAKPDADEGLDVGGELPEGVATR